MGDTVQRVLKLLAVRPQSFGGGSPTMTFNTKAAMADVHQMFSDPLARDAFHDDGDDGDGGCGGGGAGGSNCGSPTEKFDAGSLQGLPVLEDDDDRQSLAFHGTQTIGANMSTIHEKSEQGAWLHGLDTLAWRMDAGRTADSVRGFPGLQHRCPRQASAFLLTTRRRYGHVSRRPRSSRCRSRIRLQNQL